MEDVKEGMLTAGIAGAPINPLDHETFALAMKTGQQIAQPVTGEKIHFAIVPDGNKLVSLKEFQFPGGLRPERISANVVLKDAISFTRYMELFADDRTRIFADPKAMSFLAVLDYHGTGSDRAVEFLSHRASFTLETEQRWNIWAERNMKSFTQEEFAEFIEDNAADILDPPAAHMLEVARDLHATNEVNFDSKVKIVNGQVQLKYTEQITAGVGAGNLEIPETFQIKLPIFYGEDAVAITARLRYRITQGKLTFFFKMYRKQETLQDAFNLAVKAIGESLKTDVLIGTP